MMRSHGLGRRALLRGLAGVAVALPALELFSDRRATAGPGGHPSRFVFCYGGTSIGADTGPGGDMFVPTSEGPGYGLSYALQPLAQFDAAKDISVVTGLVLPWAEGGVIPPAGRVVEFHGGTATPQYSGTKCEARDERPHGPSADQIVADTIAGDTSHRSLTYRVQPVAYSGGNGGNRGRISWRDRDNPIDPVVSPRLAYESLFSGFIPPDPDDQGLAEFELRRRKSVLGIVRGATGSLLPDLGAVDRQRMERHFEELRALEQRLDQLPPPGEGACQQPMSPGDDPPIGQDHEVIDNQLYYTDGAGYSNEDLRAELLCDFIHMAMTCDLSRVASLQLTHTQCFMSMFDLFGHRSDLHELGHGGGDLQAVSDGVSWHVKHFARLVAKLRDTTEVDGTSLLDHTALVMTFEGGWGYDPEAGDSLSAHSTEHMAALLAGRAGGLKSGHHIVATDKHPAQVVLSAMRAVGHTGPFGEVTADLPELFA